jgi:hypothetical protein
MKQPRLTRAEWAKRVASWRRSGESARIFADRHGWKTTTLRWWSYQLGRDVEFVEVTSAPVAPRSRATIEIVLGNGRRLRVRGDIDAAAVATLARALEA